MYISGNVIGPAWPISIIILFLLQYSSDNNNIEIKNWCCEISYHKFVDNLSQTLWNKYLVGKMEHRWIIIFLCVPT